VDGSQGSGSGGSAPQVCYLDGVVVDCWKDGLWWSSSHRSYCTVEDPPPGDPAWNGHRDSKGNPTGHLPGDPAWNGHRDSKGNPTGHFLACMVGSGKWNHFWYPAPPTTPGNGGVDPAVVISSALASLSLHPPTVGVGAAVLKDLPEMGLATYIGAPLWLWVNRHDSLQWGSHTLSASVDEFTATATARSTQVVFDTGDGSVVTCRGPGDARSNDWDRLRDESPSRCQHRYMVRSETGNRDDRFTVSATVTWTVDWSTTDGQYGSFTFEIDSIDNPSLYVAELFVYPVPWPS